MSALARRATSGPRSPAYRALRWHPDRGWAWAFNTPFKMWKRYSSYEGGTADALIVSWPKSVPSDSAVRRQYAHAIDIVPTLYDCLGVELSETVKGYPQKPIEGIASPPR